MNEIVAAVGGAKELSWAFVCMVITLTTLRAIIRGDLVPRKVHEEVRADRDSWREQSRQADEQLDALIGLTDTTARVLNAVPISNVREG